MSIFSMAVALANCTLSLYFLLRVKYGWQDRRIAKQLEVPAYLFTLLGPFLIAIPTFITKSYNLNQIVKICWIDPYPTGCLDKDDVECTRGGWIAAGLSYGVVLIVFIASIVGFYGTYQVYVTVRDRIRSSTSRSFRGVTNNSMTNRLNEVSRQAIGYSLVYLNTIIWPVLITLAYLVFIPDQLGQDEAPSIYWLELLSAIFYPLQGFMNFLVFSLPNARKWMYLHPEKSIWWALGRTVLADPPPIRSSSTVPTRRIQQQRQSNSTDSAEWTLGSMSLDSVRGSLLDLVQGSTRWFLPTSTTTATITNATKENGVGPTQSLDIPIVTNADGTMSVPQELPSCKEDLESGPTDSSDETSDSKDDTLRDHCQEEEDDDGTMVTPKDPSSNKEDVESGPTYQDSTDETRDSRDDTLQDQCQEEDDDDGAIGEHQVDMSTRIPDSSCYSQ